VFDALLFEVWQSDFAVIKAEVHGHSLAVLASPLKPDLMFQLMATCQMIFDSDLRFIVYVMQDAVFKADNKLPTKLDHWLNDPNAVASAVYGKDSFATGLLENIGNKRQ
jgi:hypothetical protein